LALSRWGESNSVNPLQRSERIEFSHKSGSLANNIGAGDFERSPELSGKVLVASVVNREPKN
jgi:hypothetical protein